MTDDEIKEASARCDRCGALHGEDGHREDDDDESERLRLLRAVQALNDKYTPAWTSDRAQRDPAVAKSLAKDSADNNTRILTDEEKA